MTIIESKRYALSFLNLPLKIWYRIKLLPKNRGRVNKAASAPPGVRTKMRIRNMRSSGEKR